MLPLRVLVVDDHRLFRQGLISLMETRPDLVQVIGEAETGREAVMETHRLKPDAILMDIFMPHGDGLQAVKKIRRSMPEVAIVMLTSSDMDEHLYEAVSLGVSGYLLKNLDAEKLFELMEGVSRGEAALTRPMAARLLKRVANRSVTRESGREALTQREVEVLRLVAQGASNPQIAEELTISINTVKSHLRNILDKLQLENRTQAATYAIQSGLISIISDPPE